MRVASSLGYGYPYWPGHQNCYQRASRCHVTILKLHLVIIGKFIAALAGRWRVPGLRAHALHGLSCQTPIPLAWLFPPLFTLLHVVMSDLQGTLLPFAHMLPYHNSFYVAGERRSTQVMS